MKNTAEQITLKPGDGGCWIGKNGDKWHYVREIMAYRNEKTGMYHNRIYTVVVGDIRAVVEATGRQTAY